MNILNRIEESRQRLLEWFYANSVEGRPAEIKRFSAAHDPLRYPGMLLPAAYDAVYCLRLLGEYGPGSSYSAARAAEFIASFQRPDGTWRIPEMMAEEVYKRDDPDYTWEYINFHTTNYSLGALASLGAAAPRRLAFMDKYLDGPGLKGWIGRRMMDDPWMEGNNIVNLGGFYLALDGAGIATARARLDELLAWLDATQDPASGFWGDELGSRKRLLVGMAGAMHSFHLYYRLDRELRHADRIADVCLSLIGNELDGATSACLDVDIVDALANLHRLGLRRNEIERVLEKKLVDLLDFQNPDGGFADERSGTLRFDGWVRGYAEPQGLSNCFAAWFRCAAIGMIGCTLFPETAGTWTFRNTVGIGYFRTE